MMMYPYLNLGPRDGILLVAVLVPLVLTLVLSGHYWNLCFLLLQS